MLDPLHPFIELDDKLGHFNPGDRNVTEEAKARLRENPALPAEAGDLAIHAESQLIKLICHDDERATAVLKEQLTQMRAELSHESDTAMVRLLTRRVSLDWLWTHFLDLVCTSMEAQSNGCSVQFTRKRESAHRMLLASLKMHASFTKSMRRSLSATVSPSSGVPRNKNAPPTERGDPVRPVQ